MNLAYWKDYLTHHIVEALEVMLAIVVAIGIIAYVWSSVPLFLSLDWGEFETFDRFIQSMLAVFIGLEIMHLIKIQSLRDIFTIAVLILVRSSLDHANTAYESIALIVAAVAVAGAYGILSQKKLI